MTDRDFSAWGGPKGRPSKKQRVLGDYVIEREIGRGGMGVVWLATQQSLERRVALKVLPNFASMDMGAVMRFRREAEATGRLAHPGIVPVYSVGEVDGIPYFAMEYIDGPPLGALLEELSMRQVDKLRHSLIEEAQMEDRYPALREPPATGAGNRYVRSCARLCADVANALAAAHKDGVIHRDLKPNNILIHPAGRPVLVDFGLARDEQQHGLTRSGEQIGTPSYMAPEQARGYRSIDARVDVYGLGAVLYELLTLRPPFEGATTAEIAHHIIHDDPVPLRRRNPNVPVDLAAVVHRCLAKQPDDRYPTIESVEIDLRNFLSGRPVSAQLPSIWMRLQGRLQRQRRSLMVGGSAALAALAMAVTAGIVDDRGDVANGFRILDEASALLRTGAVDRARDLYERAEALTKQPAEVRQRRREDFRAAFDELRLRVPGGSDALRRFAAVFDDADRRALRDHLEQLEGRGWLLFASRRLGQRTVKLEEKRVLADGLQPDWRPITALVERFGEIDRETAADSWLPVGERLLRATSETGAEAYLWARVDPDAVREIRPRYVPMAELPEDYTVFLDHEDQRTIAIAQYEVTRGDWQRWLESMPDRQLAAEMVPLLWDEQLDCDERLPVRGLSYHQARAYAVAHQAHLPTVREQWLAGSAGLQQLVYPWGSRSDSPPVAADPMNMDSPRAVDSLPEGRSPIGVHHVLGNVAEMLSLGDDGEPRMGGGSFLDEPQSLRLIGESKRVGTTALETVTKRHAGAGLRLYRFVPPAGAPETAASGTAAGPDAGAEVAAEWRRLEQAEGGVVRHWQLQRDGRVACRLAIRGSFDGGERLRPHHFTTPGFLQRADRVQARAGDGPVLAGRVVLGPGAETSLALTQIAPDVKPNQWVTTALTAELEPVDGLLPVGDRYVLRLPLKRGYYLAGYRLTLPAGCVVESVSPEARVWHDDGRTNLLWGPTDAPKIETGVVRFRADGHFGPTIASFEVAEERTGRFLRALTERRGSVERLLDRDFVRQPGDVDLAALRRNRLEERLELRAVDDVFRIGAIETVRVRVDWSLRRRDGEWFTLEDWPMLVQWRHPEGGGAPRVVRLHPETTTDSGRYDDAGGYRHDELRVDIAAVPSSSLSRSTRGVSPWSSELCELQVRIDNTRKPPDGEAEGGSDGTDALEAQVLGYLARPGEDMVAIRFRLTNGASVLRPGTLIAERERTDGELDGRAGEEHVLLVQDWQFDAGGDEVVRERWYFKRRGRRYLLIRCALTLPLRPAEAEQKFAEPAVQGWFLAVRDAVQILQE